MSDSSSFPQEQGGPSKKTSTVPLKKETVRITLRARPEDTGPVAPKGVTQPIRPVTAPQAGTSHVQPDQYQTGSIPPIGSTMPIPAGQNQTGSIPPVGSTMPVPAGQNQTGSIPPVGSTMPVPGAGQIAQAPLPPPIPTIAAVGPSSHSPTAAPAPPPAPATPAPGQVPQAPPPAPVIGPPVGAPVPPGARTVPLSQPLGRIAPAAPIGAKTIPLAKAPPSAAGGPVIGKQTSPLAAPGTARPLPQATVKLKQTQTLGSGGGISTISTAPNIQSTAADAIEEDWEEEFEESGLMPFAIVVLLLSIAVLVIEIMTKAVGGG